MENGNSVLKTVKNVGVILSLFSAETPELGVTDICSITGLSRSKTHRLLSSLENIRLLKQNEETKKYSLGPKTLELAYAVQSRLTYRDIALPSMNALRDKTGETVAFHLFDGECRVCLFQAESYQQLRRSYTDLGKQHPLYLGAPGKAILSFLPRKKKEQLIASYKLSAKEENDLEQEMRDIVAKGYAVTSGEIKKEIVSIAAPLYDNQKHLVGALNVTGPRSRVGDREIKEYGALLLQTTEDLSTKLAVL